MGAGGPLVRGRQMGTGGPLARGREMGAGGPLSHKQANKVIKTFKLYITIVCP